MKYYSSIKRNEFEWILVRWMNTKPAIQSEVSQKEKNKYRVLMHIFGIQKNATNEPTCKAAIESADIENRMWTQQWKERVRWIERVALKHVHYQMENRWPVGTCCVKQAAQPCTLWPPRGVGWGGRWEGGSRGKGYMCTYGWFRLL